MAEGRPLTAVVQRATRGVRAARAGEMVLFAVAAGLAVLAAAVHGGAELADPAGLGVALAGAFLAGGAWWLAHREGEGAIARRLDRRLGRAGALFTAWELEGRAATRSVGPVGAELLRREGEGVSGRSAVRRLLPNSTLAIAAPFVAGAFLISALQRAGDATGDLAGLMGGAAASLSGFRLVRGPAGEGAVLPPELVAELVALEQRAQALERRWGSEAAEPEAAAAAIEELDQRLEALVEVTAPEGELGRSLEEARGWLDAARMRLEPAEGQAGAGEPVRSSLAGGEQEPIRAAGAEASPGSGATSGAGPGTMSGSPEELEPVAGTPSESPPNGSASSAPALASRWWPPEYDEVVARWVSLRQEDLDEPRSAPPSDR